MHVSVICECCMCWCITKSPWPCDAMGKGLVSVLYNKHVCSDVVICSMLYIYISYSTQSFTHIIHLFIYLNLFYTNTHIYLATMSFTLYTLLYILYIKTCYSHRRHSRVRHRASWILVSGHWNFSWSCHCLVSSIDKLLFSSLLVPLKSTLQPFAFFHLLIIST